MNFSLTLPSNLSPMAPLILTAAATAVLLTCGFMIVRSMIDFRRYRRMKALYSGIDESILLPDARDRFIDDWSGRLDNRFEGLVKQTGQNWNAAQALAMMSLLSVTLAGGLFLWREDLVLVALGLIAGQAIPLGIFALLRVRYRRQLQQQLPDALFLLSRSLRAGLSLEQALATVGANGVRPLADEFRRGADQVRMGLPVPAALHGMAERLNIPDFNIFVAAVNLSRTMGGNLSLLLDKVAASVRDRNLYRGYFNASTALSRLTAFTIAAAAPLLFIGYSLWQPELMSNFVNDPSGARAIGLAAGLEVMGCLWLVYLLRTDY